MRVQLRSVARAGQTGQNSYTIAIGTNAGQTGQASQSIAIGLEAGRDYQQGRAVAIGKGSGTFTQGLNAVALGDGAGYRSQGQYAVAIGSKAGDNNQSEYSIILNASGVELDSYEANTFVVKPVRRVSNISANVLGYTSNGEIVDHRSLTLSDNLVTVTGSLQVNGNIHASGNLVTLGIQNLVVDDPIIASW